MGSIPIHLTFKYFFWAKSIFFLLYKGMKKCYTCQSFKDETDFNRNKGKKDGLNSICKVCSRERSKRYYCDNRDKHIIVCNKQKARQLIFLKEKIATIKNKCGCQSGCGETAHCCLEFHHLSDKEKLISTMIHNGFSWDNLTKELAKCAIVCSNCHRKIHAGLVDGPKETCGRYLT